MREYRGMTAAERVADRRSRLIHAGYVIFSDLGFGEASIERLCASAHISIRAFYECFASREELFFVVLNRCREETREAVVRAAAESETNQLTRMVAAYIDHVMADRRRSRILHREARLVMRPEDVQPQLDRLLMVFVEASGDRAFSVALLGALEALLLAWDKGEVSRADLARLPAMLDQAG
ncbi:TetR/AcrR family transcriptional regulator [Herbidospora sp. NBRC 101105]|uniref:TetR/AcrR family transcriptional regulator n=1 Tax=Herbidospora sp. NBRC 101105 TaxID=3032195 RepID=UPI0024A15D9F|nr:TetR/AcrR family transcriptional regulator [Herbidospora sp. NBRC 101105]GLX92822.1 putative TetR-family transcriptional regulator [Herbidospora sp. NBRC 101105]